MGRILKDSVFVLTVALIAATSSWAQPGPPHSTRLILLGTYGGPKATKFRSEPANLLVVDGKPYLIDAGPGVDRQIAWAGFKHADIRSIFITHHHIDHDAGLVPLISLIWFEKAWHNISTPPVQIYGPPATEFLTHTALDYLSVSERIFRAGVPQLPQAAAMFQAHDIDRDGQFFADDKVRVTAAENTHYHFKSSDAATGQDRSYSYRFDTQQGSVVFTGDTGPSDAVIALARNADVLVSEVCDCAEDPAGQTASAKPGSLAPTPLAEAEIFHMIHEHVTPEDVGKIAAAAHVKTVVLTHFVPGEDSQTDMSAFTAGVKKYFSGTVIAGSDLFEYDLP